MKAILLSSVGSLIFLFAADVLAQPAAAPKAPAAPVPVVASAASNAVATPAPNVVAPVTAGANGNHSAYGRPSRAVRLRTDGNLVGRIMGADAVEGQKPIRARIALAQSGQVVHSVRSDETGYFQISGVRPGAYSVVVAGQSGFTTFSVQVLPFQQQAAAEPRDSSGTKARYANLNAAQEEVGGVPSTLVADSLAPAVDGTVATQVLAEEGILPASFMQASPGLAAAGGAGGVPAGMAGAAGAAGGAGGAGLGLGALLGAAGLGAGIGGIGGQGGGAQPPASGTVPTP